MKKGPTSKRYGEAFKRQIVSELEGGKTTLAEVRRKYGVAGGVTIRGWIQKYGSGKRVRGAALLKDFRKRDPLTYDNIQLSYVRNEA